MHASPRDIGKLAAEAAARSGQERAPRRDEIGSDAASSALAGELREAHRRANIVRMAEAIADERRYLADSEADYGPLPDAAADVDAYVARVAEARDGRPASTSDISALLAEISGDGGGNVEPPAQRPVRPVR